MVQRNLLIVDDDPNIRELLAVNLAAAGYGITTAADGSEALSRVRERRPDCIILDIMMPEIDGWEFCKSIRDDPELYDTKIVMLTAKGTEKDKMIGRDIFKADEYMTKPFDVDELQKVIERLLHA